VCTTRPSLSRSTRVVWLLASVRSVVAIVCTKVVLAVSGPVSWRGRPMLSKMLVEVGPGVPRKGRVVFTGWPNTL